MARSMLSHGMLTALAASIAVRRRGLPPGSPPPALAATVISRITLVQDEARRESVTAFLRLICFHLLWPAMAELLGPHGDGPGWRDPRRTARRERKHKRGHTLRQTGGAASLRSLCAHSSSRSPRPPWSPPFADPSPATRWSRPTSWSPFPT